MAAENFYRLITAEITLSPLHNTSLPFSSSNDDLYEMTDILKPLVKISERDSLVIPFMVDQVNNFIENLCFNFFIKKFSFYF